jgi:hypothetical protein
MAHLKLQNVRLAFARLFEPKLNQSKTAEEYGACLILDQDEPSTQALIDAVEQVAIEKWGTKAPSMLERGKLRHPIHDGDTDMEDDPAFAGKLYCNAKSRRQPQIVDRKVQPIIDQDEIFSGCYCNVSISVYVYDVPENKGVGIGLNNIQLVKKGERLSGAPDAEDEFEVLDDEPDEKPARGRKAAPKQEESKKSEAEYDDEDEDEFQAPPKAPAKRSGFRRSAK